MSDLVGNPEDRFSHNEAHILPVAVPAPSSFFLHSGSHFHKPVLGKLPLQPKLGGVASDVTEI